MMSFFYKTVYKKFSLPAVILCFFAAAFGQELPDIQDLPDKIRGYKVHRAAVSVRTDQDKTLSDAAGAEAVVRVGEPGVIEVSLTGITLEIPAEIEGVGQKGRVDFLAFEDFRVNGLKVEVEEYRTPFDLPKAEKIKLPKPVRINLSPVQALRGAFNELTDSKDEWTVTGRVFVFGRFKKYGFSFKRVVPVDVRIKIENPLKKGLAQNDRSK